MYLQATEQDLDTFHKTLIEQHGEASDGYLKAVRDSLAVEAARSAYRGFRLFELVIDI
jgi:hypothetical protein